MKTISAQELFDKDTCFQDIALDIANGLLRIDWNKIPTKNSRDFCISYDNQLNKINFKGSNDYEEWLEYDDQGNMVHFKDSYGHEAWCKYKNNELVSVKVKGYDPEIINLETVGFAEALIHG